MFKIAYEHLWTSDLQFTFMHFLRAAQDKHSQLWSLHFSYNFAYPFIENTIGVMDKVEIKQSGEFGSNPSLLSNIPVNGLSFRITSHILDVIVSIGIIAQPLRSDSLLTQTHCEFIEFYYSKTKHIIRMDRILPCKYKGTCWFSKTHYDPCMKMRKISRNLFLFDIFWTN